MKNQEQYKINVNIDEQFQKNNPGYEKCVCGYCNKIVMHPLVVRECEHGVCASCFMEKNIKKSFLDTKCPVCGLIIGTEIKASSLLATMIKNLRLKCEKGCDQVFPYEGLLRHHNECTGSLGLVNYYQSDLGIITRR